MRKPSVFISYRRNDSAGWAGRLEDDLADHFGPEHVFRDVEIPAGVDYEQHIEHVLDSCHVVIVVIGPQWASSTAPDGTLRLAQPDDLLRREVERALLRTDVDVVPVLVQGATMPAAHELPEGLQELARRQAFELSDTRWRQDVGRLVGQLHDAIEDDLPVSNANAAAHARAESPVAASRPARDGLTAVLVMVGAAVLGVSIAFAVLQDGTVDTGNAKADDIVRVAIGWGIVGALVFGAAAMTLPGVRANPIGWAIVGVFYGVAAGALGRAGYASLNDVSDGLREAFAAGISGVVVGLGLAKRMADERSVYVLSGLVGGLAGGAVVGSTGDGRYFFEIPVTIVMLAFVAAGGWSAFHGLKRFLSRA